MRIPRVYTTQDLRPNIELRLSQETSHYLCKVLRLTQSRPVLLFNGDGKEYHAKISTISKKQTIVQIETLAKKDSSPPLSIHLAQGLCRGEKMDWIIQKAVELGVTEITPIITEFSNVKLNAERAEKRLQHWRAISIHACEQCGRNFLPTIHAITELTVFLEQNDNTGIILEPDSGQMFSAAKSTIKNALCLLIGPEGGFSENEINQSLQKNFLARRLGPRILRTETAAIAAITSAQLLWGDFNNGEL